MWELFGAKDFKALLTKENKRIKEVLDALPLLSSNSMNLAEWSSRYYHYPLGEIIQYFFPPSLRKGKEAKFRESKYIELTSKGIL